MSDTLREKLANIAHEQWAGWMRYLFSLSLRNANDEAVIPKWAVERWKRQVETDYVSLLEEEKDSDRKEADKFLVEFETELANKDKQLVEARAEIKSKNEELDMFLAEQQAMDEIIERKDKLIEQMREALEAVVRVADRATVEFDMARAAIKAAKGGNMSDTPRTDEYYNDDENPTYCGFISVEFARQLERELAEARAEIERLKSVEQAQIDMLMSTTGGSIVCANGSRHTIIDKCLYCELAEAQAEIENCEARLVAYAARVAGELEMRDKLIEQMREALIVADSLVTSLIDTHVDRCASVYDFDRDIIKAALSAAER